MLITGKLLPHKWENCMTLDKYSWGFRRNARLEDILTMDEVIGELVRTVRYVMLILMVMMMVIVM